MQLPKFIMEKNNQWIFTGDGELIFYVPELFFERNIAQIDRDNVTLIGLFNYKVFTKSGSSGTLKTFKYPTGFTCKPYKMESVKDLSLVDGHIDDYRLLRFKRGDLVAVNTRNPQGVENIESFMELYIGGKIPPTINIDDITKMIIKNINLNGNSYNVSPQIIGLTVAVMCRAKNDINKPYRLSGSDNPTDYTMINIKDIPKLISSAVSITSENWDEAVTNAIINKNHKSAPVEKLLIK